MPRTVVRVPDASASRFNRSLIDDYRAVIGEDGARQMVDLFAQSYAQRRGELDQAIAAQDHAQVQRTGHTVKGMAAAAGAAALSEIGMQLQHSTESDVAHLLTLLDAEAALVLAELPAAWGLVS